MFELCEKLGLLFSKLWHYKHHSNTSVESIYSVRLTNIVTIHCVSTFCILYSVFCIHLLYCSGAEAEPGAGSCPTEEGARGGGGDHEARPGAQSEGEVDQMWE